MGKRSEDIEEDCSAFERGVSKGECLGDGHYECMNCKLFREDFKKGGWDYVSHMWSMRSLGALHIISFNEKGEVVTIKGWWS